ncbi:hypothetical protein [Adhaeribacter rhizoryzae]|uniref:DUF4861 domain-containing protein n=1 Tax=Adhaeribacter rhizoryzae TaxID=2607907 RepID=A0A5M6DKB1_9BACT|nr:hypothetical protein [Adhaeribacter rhizoryzae]KAA5547984.1 hypothetical protein F0145_08595 [Adhaeribacter rhizoryzae]
MRALRLLIVIFFCLLFNVSNAQNKFKAYFKSNIIRLSSSSATTIDTAIYVIVPKGQSLQNGKVVISINEDASSANLRAVKVQIGNDIKIGALEDTLRARYAIRVPRDAIDDKFVRLELQAYDSLGRRVELAEGNTKTTIYIKPLIADSLTTNDTWELWLFTGTNFDPFVGAKPQEFFFRANTVFKISNKLYGQIGFYKNRYFTADSTASIQVFYPNSPNRIIQGTDTSYSYTQGTYQRNISQKIDPVGAQLDFFYKITNEETKGNSNFFGTVGFDISTKLITLENKFTNIDTTTILLKQPRSGGRGEVFFPLPVRDERLSFQLPVYNYNLGLLWILDNSSFNIKAHVTIGTSFFQGARIYTPRGSTQPTVSYQKGEPQFYHQIRVFATAKKQGISFGFDMYNRLGIFPQFNYTLSKVFDLRNFLDVLTPVSSLNLNKAK